MRLRSSVVLCGLFVLIGCSRREGATGPALPDAPAVPLVAAPAAAAPAAPLSGSEIRRRVQGLFNETVTRASAYLAMASNEESQRSTLRRYAVQMSVLGIAQKIPSSPDLPGLERALARWLESLRVSYAGLKSSARTPMRRPLPATVEEAANRDLSADDIRGIVDFELTLLAGNGDADPQLVLARIIEALAKLPRLVVLTSAQPEPAGSAARSIRVRGEGYWFFGDVPVPRVALKPPSLDEELRRAGLPADVRSDDPEVRQWLEQIRGRFHDMVAGYAAYRKVTDLVRETVLHKERLDLYRDREKARGSLSLAALLPPGR